ncbi:endoribonuclease Dicer [Brachionus plicatilis]|uniref:Endoribonuclease Dicer n=1 Tax=Brachionus plicatilis TaxID=10195 RepID=A0A3M7S6C3_BRAPC|nr:endoribonuclease Dicer [Brachionus plicatilis]
MDHFDDSIFDNFTFEKTKNVHQETKTKHPFPGQRSTHSKSKNTSTKPSESQKSDRIKYRKTKLMPWDMDILRDRFTPQPYQVQLIDFYVKNLTNYAANMKNFLIFMRNKDWKNYLKLIILKEFHVRLSEIEFECDSKKFIILVTDMGSETSKYVELINRHTSLKIAGIESHLMNNFDTNSLKKLKKEAEILIMNVCVLETWLKKGFIQPNELALAIFEEVSAAYHNNAYEKTLEFFKCGRSRPIIVGFGSLEINKSTEPDDLRQHLGHLKDIFFADFVETATDLLDTNNLFNGIEPVECAQVCDGVDLKNGDNFEAKLREKIKNSYLYLEEMSKFSVANVSAANFKDLQSYINLLCVRVLNECVYLLNEVGIWCLAKSLLPFICQLDKLAHYIETAERKLSSSENLAPTIEQMFVDGQSFSCKILENPSTHQVLCLKYSSTVLRELREMCIKQFVNCKHQSASSDDPMEIFLSSFTTPKVRALVDLLRESSLSSSRIHPDELCCLILVQNKQVATSLSLLLKKLSKEDPGLSYLFPNYIIGPSGLKAECDNQPPDCYKQEDILRKFYSGELNLLICSYEMEEKIHSPSYVNLIVRFNCGLLNQSTDELPFDYFSYISVKTRAKTKNSHCHFFIEKENFENFFNQFGKFKKIESLLKNEFSHLISLNCSIHSHSVNIRSYLSMENSIYYINKYCLRLPSDSLTQLTPKIEMESRQNQHQREYKCTLFLPINSGCRQPIQSEWKNEPNMAKLNAAYRACLILCKLSEVTEYLEPVTKEIFYRQKHRADSDDEREWSQFNSCFAKNSDNQSIASYMSQRPGGNKRKQTYRKKISHYLTNSNLVSVQQSSYLYAIKCHLTTPLQLDTAPGPKKVKVFGILITKPLLDIVHFPIFTSLGEETISLELIKSAVYLSPNQLRTVRVFHKFIFSNVLRMEGRGALASNILNCPEQKQNSKGYYICLLNETNFDLEWDLMASIEGCSDRTLMKVPSYARKISDQSEEEEEKNQDKPNQPSFKFSELFYQDSVVVPYYRNIDIQPQFYSVSQIDYTLSPLSAFPVSSHSKISAFDTFYEYFACKYRILITDLNQPLLIVNHPSTRLNLLTPRYMNMKACVLQKSFHQGFKSDKKSSNSQIFLVPELVNVHPLSSSVWRQSLCLPSILYRINCLLNVEEFRREVAKWTGVGVPWFSEKFDRLEFVWDTSREIEVSNLPDHEIDIAMIESEKKACLQESEIDPKWNFEIGEWNANCLNELHSTNKNLDLQFLDFKSHGMDGAAPSGWNDENFKTLFIDPNEMNFLVDDIDSEFEDYEEEKSKEAVREDTYEEFDDEEEEMNTNKFIIDLSTLKADMKKKSAKLLSKLSVSSTNCNLVKGLVKSGIAVDAHHLHTTLKANEQNFDFSLANLTNDSILSTDCQISTNSQVNIDLENLKNFEWINKILFNFYSKNNQYQNSLDSLKNFVKNKICVDKLSDCLIEAKLDFPLRKQLLEENLAKFSAVDIGKKKSSRKKRASRAEIQSVRNTDWQFHFSLDDDLNDESGPGPALLLQALTLSNAADGFDLERLETVGDSFLKQAVTVYLFFTYPNIHEGKLSFLRSKQVSNYNLYKLGKRKNIQELIVSSKFDPLDSWLPPLYQSVINTAEFGTDFSTMLYTKMNNSAKIVASKATEKSEKFDKYKDHVLSDKSIADCVESIIGAYLIRSGPYAALQVMSWFGLEVLPRAKCEDGSEVLINLPQVPLPQIDEPAKLDDLLFGLESFEACIGYKFKEPAYLLQAFTHSSYTYNTITDCYQRLEFLGDAILDYVITRHLYEDKKRHSPGELTDLRSALVNNNIFAYLAVKYEFYKYFKYSSPVLFTIIDNFVHNQKNRNDEFDLDEELFK